MLPRLALNLLCIEGWPWLPALPPPNCWDYRHVSPYPSWYDELDALWGLGLILAPLRNGMGEERLRFPSLK